MQAILAERSIVRATLAGIPKRDRDDVEAEVFLAAWRTVKRGMYRPAPQDEPRAALRKWLHGISWRQASHYFESAWVRRAVLHAEPLGLLHGSSVRASTRRWRRATCSGRSNGWSRAIGRSSWLWTLRKRSPRTPRNAG
ncbi:hypothetical protein [Sorangium sp. So ce1078]|uniref:hypothetical protein n=1 Tax=Sorangium sp. So ce1078 TaxID=3133329 RepID=UPI003F5EC21C